MSHFTTAVSLSGVAKTWSRITLQSFQDLWKYPLHVFSCMCAWAGWFFWFVCWFVCFWGWGLFPTKWMWLIIATLDRTGKIHLLLSQRPRFWSESISARASLSAGTFVRLCRAVDRKCGATIKHKKPITGRPDVCQSERSQTEEDRP